MSYGCPMSRGNSFEIEAWHVWVYRCQRGVFASTKAVCTKIILACMWIYFILTCKESLLLFIKIVITRKAIISVNLYISLLFRFRLSSMFAWPMSRGLSIESLTWLIGASEGLLHQQRRGAWNNEKRVLWIHFIRTSEKWMLLLIVTNNRGHYN